MAMYHHDARSTEQATNEAREYMRRNVQKNAVRAARGLAQLQERVIIDSLQPLSDVKYELSSLGGGVAVNGNVMTSQAFGQLCAKAEMPVGYARKLLAHESPLARNLVIENLETLSAVSDSTTMLRTVNGIVHGVVSDSYKRMDSRLIVGSFAEALQSNQLLPVQCELSATRVYMRALMPRIYGEEFGEAIAFGITLSASDFGFGPVSLKPFAERVWCTNRAQMTISLGKGLSKQHRGARVTEETFALSAQTQELQAMAMASEFKDAVKGLLSGESIDMYVGAIGRCFAEGQRGGKFEAEREIAALVEKHRVNEKTAKFVTEVYASTDRDVVPAMDGRWKLSQAIAYAAQHADGLDVDARVDLEYLAGEIVESAPKNALPAYAN